VLTMVGEVRVQLTMSFQFTFTFRWKEAFMAVLKNVNKAFSVIESIVTLAALAYRHSRLMSP